MKLCKRCGKVKPLTEFRLNKSIVGVKRYYYICEVCEKEYFREKYAIKIKKQGLEN